MTQDDTERRAKAEKHKAQVAAFAEKRPLYQAYAKVLEAILRGVTADAAPLAIVQARAKTVDSFSEKALRQSDRLDDPVNELHDLCGGRVIAHTQRQVERISERVESLFKWDREASMDKRSALGTGEFGYLSVHYIVCLDPEVEYGEAVRKVAKDSAVALEDLHGLVAEIQVRTVLQHAWADVVHDRLYKNEFEVPERWHRVSSRLAAVLENADDTFQRLADGVDAYQSYFGAYMSPDEMDAELDLLKMMMETSSSNRSLALRLAKLAHAASRWDVIIDALEEEAEPKTELGVAAEPALLCELGNALCEKYTKETQSPEFERGQGYLKTAIELSDPTDPDIVALYARSWEPRDKDPHGVARDRLGRARANHRRAFELAPEDPYHLSSFLEFEIEEHGHLESSALLQPMLERAIDRCREHVAGGVEFPRAYFTIGRLSLLLGDELSEYRSLAAYAKAIRRCLTERAILPEEVIRREIAAVERMGSKGTSLDVFDLVRCMLTLAQSVISGDRTVLEEDETLHATSGIEGPVVILAGGCSEAVEADIRDRYTRTLVEAFEDFEGTVVSGGTTQGACGIAAAVKAAYRDRIALVGYIPSSLPADATKDEENYALVVTSGDHFSPLQPMKAWADIIASKIKPSEVTLIGINGGNIAAFEYQLATALGAKVAVIAESGRKADEILADEEWAEEGNLAALPFDPMTLRVLLEPKPAPLGERDKVAEAAHEAYRASQIKTMAKRLDDPALASWEKLDEALRDSNRAQADDIGRKLEMIGYEIVSAHLGGEDAEDVVDEKALVADLKTLAEREHARWNIERLFTGWRWGETKDIKRRRNPALVAWERLPEKERVKDEKAVMEIPEQLRSVGLALRKKKE